MIMTVMEPEPTTIPCLGCDQPVEIMPVMQRLADTSGAYCQKCIDGMHRHEFAAAQNDLRLRKFANLCPPCFPDTDANRLPCRHKSFLALDWLPASKGLNLWGEPGTGKTRTMSLILQRELAAGKSVVALGPGGFREQCERRNYHRAPYLRWLSTVDILFLDDLDKMNLTRGLEKELFAVLSNRMGRLPVLTTGNTPGARLEKQFSLGAPMVDRIRRYCINIHFP